MKRASSTDSSAPPPSLSSSVVRGCARSCMAAMSVCIVSRAVAPSTMSETIAMLSSAEPMAASMASEVARVFVIFWMLFEAVALVFMAVTEVAAVLTAEVPLWSARVSESHAVMAACFALYSAMRVREPLMSPDFALVWMAVSMRASWWTSLARRVWMWRSCVSASCS